MSSLSIDDDLIILPLLYTETSRCVLINCPPATTTTTTTTTTTAAEKVTMDSVFFACAIQVSHVGREREEGKHFISFYCVACHVISFAICFT